MLPAEQLGAARKALLEPLPPVDPNKRKRKPEPKPTQQEITLSKKEARQKEAREKEAKQRAAKRKGKGKGSSKSIGEAAQPDARANVVPAEGKNGGTETEASAEAQVAKEDVKPGGVGRACPEATPPEQVAAAACEQSTDSVPVDASAQERKPQKTSQVDAVTPLPEDGDWMRLRHLEKLILRPMPRRGVCSREVGAPLDAQAVAAELRDNFRSAVEAAQGMFLLLLKTSNA